MAKALKSKKPSKLDKARGKAVHLGRLIHVQVIASERGWGQEVLQDLYFEKAEDAKAFVDLENAGNTANTVPDYYVYAKIV